MESEIEAGSSTGTEPAGPGPGEERHLQQLLEQLPAAAYTCDLDGLITYFNRQAVELWGRTPLLRHPEDRFCGSSKLFTPEGVPIPNDACWMALALRHDRVFSGRQVVIERPSGERVTVLAHASPLRDGAGQLVGAVEVLVDISEHEHEHDQQAQRELDRSRDALLAMLSHEMRNPLAPIRAAVQILQLRGSASKEGVEALEVIERQVQQMSSVMSNLLDGAHLGPDKLELRRERELSLQLDPGRSLPARAAPADSAAADRRSLRILVVDDNRDAAGTLGTLLRLQGYQVSVANTGEAALELAEAFRPSVLVLDLGLPGMDGWQLAREIRRRPWAGDTLLIALTGLGQAADRLRSHEAGFDHHLVKPLDPPKLRALLAEHCKAQIAR